LIEQIPVNNAGILTLPPISLPIPIGLHKDDINPDYPPELPPVFLFRFQIFLDLPKTKLLA
jgi:hypothetical protein